MAAISPMTLGLLFDTCSARLVLYARQWLPHEEAQDVTQEAFIKLMTVRTAPDNPRAWLFTAVRNAAISGLRSSGSRQRRERSIARNRDALFASDPTTPLVASEATEALSRLGAELRETLTLRIWGQLTFAEIAVVTDTPLSTVHHRYHEALADLRARLEKPCPKI